MLAEGSMRKRRSWILGGATGGLIPIAAISLVIASASLISCTNRPQPESDQQLKQQAANATQTVKQQSKDALANARVAAANAERKVNDIADGVKQGMDNHSSLLPGPPSTSTPHRPGSWNRSRASRMAKQARSWSTGRIVLPMTL
jgi:hypothetical protein